MSAPADNPTLPAWDSWEAQRRRLLAFLALVGLYMAGLLLCRWVVEPLFAEEDACYGQDAPSWFERGYFFFMTLLPIFAWGALIFCILTLEPHLAHRSIAFLLLLAGFVFLEADMRWFYQSRRHVSLSELQAFFHVDGEVDLGLRPSDYWTFWLWVGIHTLALILCFLMSGPEGHAVVTAVFSGPLSKTLIGKGFMAVYEGAVWLRDKLHTWRLLDFVDTRATVIAVAVLVVVDPIIVWHYCEEEEVEEGYSNWRDLAQTNPLRLQSLDRLTAYLANLGSDHHQDLAAANAALREASDAPAPPNKPGLHLVNRDKPDYAQDVVVIQVESLNPFVLAQTKMPALEGFASKCLRLNRHFSSGNCTHYGVLGLLHGTPVTFFRGGLDKPTSCPYLTLFYDDGYRSRLLSRGLMHHHRLGDYLSNWTQPIFTANSESEVPPEFAKEMKTEGAAFFYVFYHNTHYPYRHASKFNTYTPETEEDFAYSRPDLRRFKTEIVNRYKNSLVEFDKWFEEVLASIDLSKTIVVLTGDHGEELLENGRLGHCGSFNKYQTMTPCYVHIPGIKPQDVNFTTSHADIMPTIADALHVKKPEGLGQSLFQPVPYRYAAVATFEYKRPVRWAIVTDDRKAIVEEMSGNTFEIFGLLDDDGRRLTYRDQAAAWADSLHAIRLLEKESRKTP